MRWTQKIFEIHSLTSFDIPFFCDALQPMLNTFLTKPNAIAPQNYKSLQHHQCKSVQGIELTAAIIIQRSLPTSHDVLVTKRTDLNWKDIRFEISFDPWEELGPIVPRYGFSAEFIWHHAAIDLFHEVFKAKSNQWTQLIFVLFQVLVLY